MERNVRIGLVTTIFALCSLPVYAQQGPPEAVPGGPGGPPPVAIAGQTFPVPMGWGPPIPELGKKMTSLAVLRELHLHRFTAPNLAAAVPQLKKLRDAEKSLQTRSDQLIEEEKRALLELQPDDPLPVGSGQKIQLEVDRYRILEEETWAALRKEIGAPKTDKIRQLIGRLPMGGFGGFPGAGGFGGGFGGGGFGGGVAQPANPAPGQRPGRPPRRPTPGEPGNPTQPTPEEPEGQATTAPEGEEAPVPEGGKSDNRPLPIRFAICQNPADATAAAPEQAPGVAPPTPGQAPRARAQRRGGQNLPGDLAQTVPGVGFRGGMAFGGFGGQAFFGPSVSLNELITLMEQKLSAMRR